MDLNKSAGKSKKLDSGSCGTGIFDSHACDVESSQGATALAFNLLSMSTLSNFDVFYGGGLGIYHIIQTLRITADGRESRTVASNESMNISSQIKFGLNYGNFQIIYSHSPKVGSSKVGSGSYQQIGLSYGSWK